MGTYCLDEALEAASWIVSRTCLMIFGCSDAPPWNGTVTLRLPLAVDAMAALGPEQLETGRKQRPLGLGCRPPGSLGIYPNSGGQNLTAEQDIALLVRQRLEVEFDRLSYVRHGRFQRVSLRLAPLQFGARSDMGVFRP